MQIQSMEINSISRCELTPKMNNITRRRIVVVYVGNLKKKEILGLVGTILDLVTMQIKKQREIYIHKKTLIRVVLHCQTNKEL